MSSETAPAPERRLLCICGAAAPSDLPAPGASPVPCVSCRTPLVRPGSVSDWRVKRAFGGALVVAVACALAWMLLSASTGTGVPVVVAVTGALVGVAARVASRSRGTAIQLAALGAFVLFVMLGEVLLFQKALHPRLVAMHQLEGAAEPEIVATKELERLRRLTLDKKVEHFLHIEATLGLFVALAVGSGLALLVTRASPGLAAFNEALPAPSVALSLAPSVEHAETESAIDAQMDPAESASALLDSLEQIDETDAGQDKWALIDDALIGDPSFVHPVEEEPPYDLADADVADAADDSDAADAVDQTNTEDSDDHPA